MLSLYITAKVAGKHVSIFEASIKRDLLFDNADGIDSLPNQAIFYAIQLMGYEGDLTVLNIIKSFVSPHGDFFSTMNHVSSKTIIASKLVQPTGMRCTSERPSEPQPTPSPPHPSEANVEPQSDPSPRPSPTTHILDSIPDETYKILAGKKTLKKKLECKGVCIKQGGNWAKAEPSVHKDPLFDELPDDTLDYMDTEDAQDVGRTRDVVNEEKESVEDAVSTEGVVSTDKEKVSTDRPNVSTDRPKVNTDKNGKKKIEEEDESDTESKGIPEAEKKFKQLARDEEMARKVQEDWEAEEEVKKLAKEEAIKAALIN
ncbi:hypothetical protein Tco_0624519 [Tanacetum coccineum]|uniref:Uncharacterized protein n=1 Tax=Tanacetum coccineum TaxID=301880 RepID=A0ABQ4WE61_9ASTR